MLKLLPDCASPRVGHTAQVMATGTRYLANGF